jgi:sarcosine oxidase, subunit gamma
MAEHHPRQSPLAHLRLAARWVEAPGEAAVWICERRFLGMLNLRGPGDSAFAAAVHFVLGMTPPLEPNRAVEQGERRMLWLGPDEWLLVTQPDEAPVLQRRLIERLIGQFTAVTEVSEGRAVIGLAGPKARELLSHGTPLDLHPRVFGPGQCAQTHFAQMPVILHQRDASPIYDLYVQRSLGEHLWRWLETAAREYGLVILEG